MKRYAICLRHSRRKKRRSRKELLRQQQSTAAGGKVFCPTFCTLQKVGELPPSLWEVFNFVRAKPPLRRAASRFGKPRISLQGRTDLFFSLVRKEPKVPQRFANLWTPGTIQSSVGNNLREASDGTSRNRFFAQNGGEKALNRCDARALQRKDLEWRLKERPYSLRTVGYGWVQVGDGGQKRKAFSAHARQCKNEKPFINQLWQHFSTMPKLTCSYKFHPRNPTVSLQ